MRQMIRAWPAVLMVGLVFWTTTIQAQPRFRPFKGGKFQFIQDGKTFTVPLLGDGSSSLDIYKVSGKETRLLGLVYQPPRKPGQITEAQARMALQGIAGPGKYGNDVIKNFVVQVGISSGWNFYSAQHKCTFTFSRVDLTGVEGTVACSGTNGGTVPWSDAKFSARP